jgi:hypothetical protein
MAKWHRSMGECDAAQPIVSFVYFIVSGAVNRGVLG